MEYKILREDYIGVLEDRVIYEMESGWRPIGGVAVEGRGVNAHYMQAMLKG